MSLSSLFSKPDRRTIAALVGAITLLLAGLAVRDCFIVADELGLPLWQSKTLLAIAALRVFLMLAGVALCFVAWFFPKLVIAGSERFSDLFNSLAKFAPILRFFPVFVLPGLLYFFFFLFLKTQIGGYFADHTASRVLLFWIFSLVGSLWIKASGRVAWFHAWLLSLLFLSAGYRLVLFLPEISASPFSLGWSEGSRLYLPALFNSQAIFGKPLPLPILHPTLHLLLYPPYAIGAPILLHRLWRVGLLLLLTTLTSHALLRRVGFITGGSKPLLLIWLTLTLLTLPVYLHLLVPVILLLWFVSTKQMGRTLVVLAVASVWAGLSRINWYPVPALLTIALLLLDRKDQPFRPKDLITYAALFLGGSGLAALSMQTYIRLSGITQTGDFFTSLNSSLLWDRLLPSQTYSLGVLPGILLFAVPFIAALTAICLPKPNQPSPLPIHTNLLLATELTALFFGGLLVSTKIGGGSDIHNMDAFAILLLIISATLLLANRPPRLHWAHALSFVLVPAVFITNSLPAFTSNTPLVWQSNLQSIQATVDANNAAGKPTLFISQRQLISLGHIRDVDLNPLYDREDLMEMAMSGNQPYLDTFAQNLTAQTYGAIIVDPLTFTYKGTADAMGAEHNAWTKSVIRPILCNYQLSQSFAEAKVAIYLPQQGQRNCPTLPQKGGN